MSLEEVERVEERQIDFRETVGVGQVISVTKDFFTAGRITQIMFHFPPGASGLLDMRLLKDGKQMYPNKGYIALDDATPVYYVSAEYYPHEPLTVEFRNRDDTYEHTGTCSVVIRFKKPGWWT